MFVNPDVTPRIDTLDSLEKTIVENRALVAPQLQNLDGTPQPNGRGWPTLRNKVLHRIDPSRTVDTYRLFASPGELREVVWLTGAAIASSRQQLEAIGVWDERYFLYYEDSDLCLRARKAGIPSIVDGSAIWTHVWARETAGLNIRAWRHEISSLVKFYAAHPGLLFAGRAEEHAHGRASLSPANGHPDER
jgi:GT2 family glycosyltransferase